jgi:hypothetical protein
MYHPNRTLFIVPLILNKSTELKKTINASETASKNITEKKMIPKFGNGDGTVTVMGEYNKINCSCV